jgi:hypothetical protein
MTVLDSLWMQLLGLLLTAGVVHWLLRSTPRGIFFAFPPMALAVTRVIWQWGHGLGHGAWPAALPRALEPLVVFTAASLVLCLPALGARVGFRRARAGAAA